MKLKRSADCYLKPGDFHLALTPTLIKTVLGSCITVTMYSSRAGIGAACHALLPACRGEAMSCRQVKCPAKSRYVECIIPEMILQFQEQGVVMNELEIKLFGGADIMKASPADHQWVGKTNVQMAKTVLARVGMTIKSSDIGGTVGRKLIFDTGTGDVWIKRLNVSC
jgi:chemotaxis protein CheD